MSKLAPRFAALVVVALPLISPPATCAQRVPHGQDRPPGPALSPQEAIERMKVPEGFHVEVVAAEPQIVNPVAMTFDERGRIWITESLEYPRLEAGPGRDRVKVLEDRDHDGRIDSVQIFAEGLNIPSGIAVGHGGVWVANSPDLLFLQDTDGDGRADRRQVVVTGFGRRDTHELPNSLTWGPDGYLYGLNGVFNPSVVKQNGKEFRFTCALFRIDPRSHEFQLFAEGTSNPWGVAFNPYGDAFVSACVIDHLWHLAESGYYHRQGGPYPPFTWKLGSIVKHKHQKAAYCGIHYFDSDAYPEQYRDRLYMGNIHGNCINVDVLEQRGSSYFAKPAPDFLSAGDAWFMPVAQKTGPDGCLYVLDWYDRYHCYQDARRDPEGIDRLKGRLYRIRYQETPRAGQFDLARESEQQLIERLGSGNIYYRDQAQRLLSERNASAANTALERLILAPSTPEKQRMHALWARIGAGQLKRSFHIKLLEHDLPELRAWGVRAAGNKAQVEDAIAQRVARLARDPDPRVQLQAAIAATKIEGLDAIDTLLGVLHACGDDEVIPHIVWQNLHPLLPEHSGALLATLSDSDALAAAQTAKLLPRVVDRVLALESIEPQTIARLVDVTTRQPTANREAARQSLEMLLARLHTGELSGERLAELRLQLAPVIARLRGTELNWPAELLAASWGEAEAAARVAARLQDATAAEAQRLDALAALVTARSPQLLAAVEHLFASADDRSRAFRAQMLSTLRKSNLPGIAGAVLQAYPQMDPRVKPVAVELLTDRQVWAERLLEAIAQGSIPTSALNANQARKLLALDDPQLTAAVEQHWGRVRSQRDPAREALINTMRVRIRRSLGDAHRGQLVYGRVCGQCHKMYGEGEEVGPEITVNGRASFDQLLSNVFDPNLVIGAAYQSRTVVTLDGRVITGLLVEEGPQRVVLKVQGGKTETVPRSDIDEVIENEISLMPEKLETQVTSQELYDLFAFLTLDRPPSDPAARRIPGTLQISPESTEEPDEYAGLLDQAVPGFRTRRSGEGGVALLEEYAGRVAVVRTHPVSRERPCVLKRTVELPAGRRSELVIEAAHDRRGDWQLVVRADGKTLVDRTVGPETSQALWLDLNIDLSSFAGRTVELAVENRANGWSWEHAYWGRVDVVVEQDPPDTLSSGELPR